MAAGFYPLYSRLMPTATFVVDPASKEKSLGILEWLWLANPPAAASRIDLSWTDKTYAGMTASLDGTQLGTVRDPMTLAQGANFRLPDRSNLRVTLRGNHLTVTRNGRPLQPV